LVGNLEWKADFSENSF